MKWMALACIVLVLLAAMPGVAGMASVGERTTHFNIKYGDTNEFAPGTGKVLEDCYKLVNGYFGNLPKSISVSIVDGDQMDNVGKYVEAFSAWNHKSSKIVLRDKTVKDKKSLPVVATHEISHLALNDLLEKKGGNEFAWMEEGTCMVISKEPLDDVKISKYIVSQGFLDLPGIAKAIDNDEYTVTKNGYLQSFSLCKYIAGRFGVQALVSMIKSPTRDFKRAFRECTGANFDQVYNAWERSVEEKAHGSSIPKTVPVHGYLNLDLAY